MGHSIIFLPVIFLSTSFVFHFFRIRVHPRYPRLELICFLVAAEGRSEFLAVKRLMIKSQATKSPAAALNVAMQVML